MKGQRRRYLILLPVVLLLPIDVIGTPVSANVIADSVADFSDTQGLNNWFYGYYDGESSFPYTPHDFKELPAFEGGRWVIQEGPGGYWTNVAPTTAHPNGLFTSGGRLSAEHWAVRRWISDVVGRFVIKGELVDNNPFPGLSEVNGGVIGRIFLDDVEVFSHIIEEGEGINYSIPVNLSIGSVVDFAVDPKDSTDLTDSTTFTVQVVVPEPSPTILVGLGLMLSLMRRCTTSRTR